MSLYYSLFTPQIQDEKIKKEPEIKYSYLALLASSIGIIGFLPQLVHVYKTKDVKSFSLIWL